MQVIYYVDYDSFGVDRKLKFPEFINKDYKDLSEDDKKNILQQCAQDFYEEDKEYMDGFTLYVHVYSPENDEMPLFCGSVTAEVKTHYSVELENNNETI